MIFLMFRVILQLLDFLPIFYPKFPTISTPKKPVEVGHSQQLRRVVRQTDWPSCELARFFAHKIY